MEVSVPTLTLALVSPDREYGVLLKQTQIVYDQLLGDKHSKLSEVLLQRKAQYDAKCAELQAQNSDKALEFGVRAQQALNNLQKDLAEELAELCDDYQSKLNHMHDELETKWKEDRAAKTAGGAPRGKKAAAIPCNVFRHK